MPDDELIEAAASAAADGVEALEPSVGPENRVVRVDFASLGGLMVIPQPPSHALVWGIPPEFAPEDFGLNSNTMPELGFLPSPNDAAWREVSTRIEGGDYSLFEPFFLALAARIRALTGLPVLVYELDMSYEEQLARQES